MAVALRWTPGALAPDIVAAGRGLAGRQLVVAARQRAVPALADDALAGALVGQRAVPAAHQAAVARALAALAGEHGGSGLPGSARAGLGLGPGGARLPGAASSGR
ncbi:MAG: EscU/YscU/HrcU family type III secretion system export apparatus switch protein [Kofleriaceae bacterium]|nr:EscU/YscU/HrcU family type III secretion system export apparatus switch protein [Kofleriaceae bacterium]